MSDLTFLEKERLEDIFEMSDGYVLNFTDRTFREFLTEAVGKDIYSPAYSFNGTSKAKRFRAFWKAELNSVVGKALSSMLDYWEIIRPEEKQRPKKELYKKCRDIVDRLLGKKAEQKAARTKSSKEEFLSEKYEKFPLNKIPLEPQIVPILERRWEEAQRCLKTEAPLAVIFLCGSLLEGILLGVACRKESEFYKAAEELKKEHRPRREKITDWTLYELVNVAQKLGLLRMDVMKFSHALREFRNYIHPYKEMVEAKNFSPDMDTAKICVQVLRATISHLNKYQ